MNFCKDCRYALGDLDDLSRLKCGHSKNSIEYTDAAKYAVTGKEQPTVSVILAASCIPMRTHKTHPTLGIELCGPEGKWWEKLE